MVQAVGIRPIGVRLLQGSVYCRASKGVEANEFS